MVRMLQFDDHFLPFENRDMEGSLAGKPLHALRIPSLSFRDFGFVLTVV